MPNKKFYLVGLISLCSISLISLFFQNCSVRRLSTIKDATGNIDTKSLSNKCLTGPTYLPWDLTTDYQNPSPDFRTAYGTATGKKSISATVTTECLSETQLTTSSSSSNPNNSSTQKLESISITLTAKCSVDNLPTSECTNLEVGRTYDLQVASDASNFYSLMLYHSRVDNANSSNDLSLSYNLPMEGKSGTIKVVKGLSLADGSEFTFELTDVYLEGPAVNRPSTTPANIKVSGILNVKVITIP